MKYSNRLNQLGTENAFKVLRYIQKLPEERRKRIISFAIGEPDFNTPEHIKLAGIKAIQKNYTHYTPSAGIPELRNAVAEFVSKTKKINITSENIVILPSAKFVVNLAILSCTNPGDDIIYPNPGYPIYESLIQVHGCNPCSVQLKENEDWNYNIDEIRGCITERTKMIIINSPQNPTGSVLNKKNIKELSDIALENDIWILADDIYSNIIYDNLQFNSIASYPEMLEKTIILDGFSKFFAMTGWRLGYAIVNKKLAEFFERWITNTVSCTASFTQQAGITALIEDKSPSKAMVEEFEKRRNLIYERLNKIDGISTTKPKGAFYIFANVSGACEKLRLKNSLEFQDYMLEKADVAVLSRYYFGRKNLEEQDDYVRFSYCVSRDTINEGIDRIERLLL